MILSDKKIAQLVKKLSKKPLTKKSTQRIVDTTNDNTRIESANADEIFREMKKLPYTE
jgi:hypothetical protein